MKHQKKFEPLRIANQLCFAVYSTAHAFTAAYKPMLDRIGITYPQYLVLMALWEQDRLMVKEIGERLHLDSGTLTPLLKRLEKSGFVRRRRDDRDERQVRVELTTKGLNTRESALEGRDALVCSLGAKEQDLQALKQGVDKLRSALRASVAEP